MDFKRPYTKIKLNPQEFNKKSNIFEVTIGKNIKHIATDMSIEELAKLPKEELEEILNDGLNNPNCLMQVIERDGVTHHIGFLQNFDKALTYMNCDTVYR